MNQITIFVLCRNIIYIYKYNSFNVWITWKDGGVKNLVSFLNYFFINSNRLMFVNLPITVISL